MYLSVLLPGGERLAAGLARRALLVVGPALDLDALSVEHLAGAPGARVLVALAAARDDGRVQELEHVGAAHGVRLVAVLLVVAGAADDLALEEEN